MGGVMATSRPHPLSMEAEYADVTPLPHLQIGDRVVWITDSGPEFGEVKWIGKILDIGTGLMVGVEFDNPIGTGTGKYKNHQLFKAKLNHASLIPIIGLMKADNFLGDRSNGMGGVMTTNGPHPLSMEAAYADGTPLPHLQIGDRVVWITDSGPEFGEVKWIGKILDIGSELMVGVEFDNPIGAGTGNYKNHQLFKAKLNHASLISITGLMKADVFLGDRSYGSGGALPYNRPRPPSMEAACADGTPPQLLQIGDRVVWISDSGPEFGEVKWLGKLLDVGTELVVGIEFDNPIGTGTGKYKHHQLFKAKFNHASLIPITGIMKADVYLGDKSCNREARPEMRSFSFQTQKQPAMPSCSVCLESLNGEIYALLCTHPFHRACLVECIRQRIIKCPLCQRMMTLAVIKDLIQTTKAL